MSSTPATTVTALYERELVERGFKSDPAQLRAVAALQRCQDEWAAYKSRRSNAITKMLVRPPIPRGVYMFGGVGRGKSFLMDCFFQAVPLQRKTRLHFHEFMREVHRELQDLKGTVDPLDELGRRIARRFRLICFDEFHVADVTDAMILHRLLDALFANRVSIVTTSNFHPDGLYPNGLHRDRILPAIELIKAKLEVINVDNGTDYRQRTLQHVQLYHTPLGLQADAAMDTRFANSESSRRCRIIASVTSATWNSSKQIRRKRRAMRLPSSSSGFCRPFRSCNSRCTSRMNSWKCRRVLRVSGTAWKNASIRKLLPRPTPPYMYTPRGMGGRTSALVIAFERRAL
jgi:predicted ATPase